MAPGTLFHIHDDTNIQYVRLHTPFALYLHVLSGISTAVSTHGLPVGRPKGRPVGIRRLHGTSRRYPTTPWDVPPGPMHCSVGSYGLSLVPYVVHVSWDVSRECGCPIVFDILWAYTITSHEPFTLYISLYISRYCMYRKSNGTPFIRHPMSLIQDPIVTIVWQLIPGKKLPRDNPWDLYYYGRFYGTSEATTDGPFYFVHP